MLLQTLSLRELKKAKVQDCDLCSQLVLDAGTNVP